MEFQFDQQPKEILESDFIRSSLSTGPHPKLKTSLRLKYEAEARVILKQLGGLDEIRQRLGLSQRKICQLLLVDPSAWTRWTKNSEKMPPPHVVKALQWYLELEEKNPAWSQWREMVLQRESVQSELTSTLKKVAQKHETLSRSWKVLLILSLGLSVFSLLRTFF